MTKFKFNLIAFLESKGTEIFSKLLKMEPDLESYLWGPMTWQKNILTITMMPDDILEYRIIPNLMKIFSHYDIDIMKYQLTSTLTLGKNDKDRDLTRIEFKIIKAIN